MLNHVRFLVVGTFVLAACGNPEKLHQHGATGSGGLGGAAGTGAAGTTGVAGSGQAGTVGQAGDTAVTGQAGTNADAGTNGQAGTTAQAGTNGQAGTTAQAGTNGQAGTTAQAGTNGQAGTTAQAGTNGQAGTTAQAGTNGQAGTTAQAGTTGTPDAGTPGIYTNYCSPVHWTVSAPTPVNAMDFPSNAIDGDAVSRWATGAPQVATGQYLQIDFSGTVSLTQVVLDNSGGNAADYPRGYDVGVSANGTSFTSVATGTPAAGAVVTINFAAAQGRYLRINQTGTAGSWWSVDEVRVACTVPGTNPDAGLIDPYDPTNWSATASKTAAGDTPGKAIDGNAATRWATGADQVGGETFTLDIAGIAMVSELWLDGGGAADFPAMYKLEVSTDGTTFNQVATGAGAQLTKIVFTRQNARFLRVTQTGTAAKWWSIYAITLKP